MHNHKTIVRCKICKTILKKQYQRNRQYCRPCWAVYVATRRSMKKKEDDNKKRFDAINNMNILFETP